MVAPRKPSPPKTDAYRARQAANSRAYRARKSAERNGVDVAPQFQLQRSAQYHPPRIPAGAGKRETARIKATASRQSMLTAAERASARAQGEREARARVIGRLPQGRNAEGEIFIPRPLKRRVPANADATVIRRKAASEKLQAVGRGLKRDFKSKPGTTYADVERRLSRREFAKFRGYMERLSALSNQALAIYFHHEGGSGMLDSVITGILYPPDGGSPADALKRLDRIVKEAEQGEANYGEEAIAAMDVETRESLGADDKGRLRI